MIAGQRKAHKFIWLGISLIIPVLLFFALKDVSFSNDLVKNDNNQFEVNILKEHILSVKLHKPLQNSSSVLYEIDANGKLGDVLGQLGGKGEYLFELSKDAKGISVMDNLKNKKIYTTRF